MANILFQVVDTTCEKLNRGNFTPVVDMTTSSVTSIKTRRGYPPFSGGDSVLYKKATHSGYAYSWISTIGGGAPPNVPLNTFIGGNRWNYSGSTEINALGQYINHHSKALHTPDGLPSQKLLHSLTITSGGVAIVLAIRPFYGFCAIWDQASLTFSGCGGNPSGAAVGTASIGWPFASEWGLKSLIDFPPFVPVSSAVQTRTHATYTLAGASSGGVWWMKNFFPQDWGSLVIGYDLGVQLSGAISYRVELSVPFTDDDLDDSTVTYQGNSPTALTDTRYQRYTVYDVLNIVQRHVAVAFSINCTNLIPGENYRVTYQLVHPNSISVQTVDFEATAETRVITGSVPTPADGKTITVRNPTIAYLT